MYKFNYSKLLAETTVLYKESINAAYIDKKLNKNRAIIAINLIKINNDFVCDLSTLLLKSSVEDKEMKNKINFMMDITSDINNYIEEIKLEFEGKCLDMLQVWNAT